MSKTYYNSEDLKKFGDITNWNKKLGEKFFDYYKEVFKEGLKIDSQNLAIINNLGMAYKNLLNYKK